jgi:hypothetical protein
MNSVFKIFFIFGPLSNQLFKNETKEFFKKALFIIFAYFSSVNILTMTDFKLPRVEQLAHRNTEYLAIACVLSKL